MTPRRRFSVSAADGLELRLDGIPIASALTSAEVWVSLVDGEPQIQSIVWVRGSRSTEVSDRAIGLCRRIIFNDLVEQIEASKRFQGWLAQTFGEAVRA